MKSQVLFVGCFKETAKDGGVGGQLFACNTIVKSNLSDSVDWTLIDTTADSNILANIFSRLNKAIARLFKFSKKILFHEYDFILIFVADGLSFWEKGFMSLLAKIFTRSKVILAPRSGFIINDLNRKGFLSKFINLVFKKVDIVICQSRYWKNLFEICIAVKDDSRFVIIENMIDFENYSSFPIRNTNGIVNILFMAWVTRNKGIYELIEAAKLLKEENFQFKLIIAGNGEDFENIRQEIELSKLTKYVEMKGWVIGPEKLQLLSESDIFVLPTYFDGYPNSLMEAMAAGKACVASNVGSIPDMIDQMESGIIIEKENHIQLYEGLKVLIENTELRISMSEKAREKIKTNNSIHIGISKFKNLFRLHEN